MAEQHHYTVAEAADYLRISKREVERCMHTTNPIDRIPSATLGEKRTKRVLRRADLDDWFDRHMEN